MNRRKFLGYTAASTAALTIVPQHLLGGAGFAAPGVQDKPVLQLTETPLASDRMSYAHALTGRFEPRQNLPSWMRVPRWCTTDLPRWREDDMAKLINGYADRHADCLRLGTFWGGVANFPSRFAPHSPKLLAGTDPLAVAVATIRQRRMHILAYINPNSYLEQSPLYDTACIFDEAGHPGRSLTYNLPGTRYACINNPAFATFYTLAIQEVVAHYGTDGIYVDGLSPHICYCKYCREKFKQDTGRELPAGLGVNKSWTCLWEMASDWDNVEDVQNPDHALYSRWLMKCLSDMTRLFTETAHGAKLGALATYHTWPKPDTLPLYDATLNEIYAKKPWHFTLWKQAEFANWGNVFQIPSLVNVYLRVEPWGKELRPIQSEVEARHKYWQSLANGGYPNAWAYPGMERPFAVMQQHADCFDFETTLPVKSIALPRPMFSDARHLKILQQEPWMKASAAKQSAKSTAPDQIDRFLSPSAGMYAGLLLAGLPIMELHPNHITRQNLEGFRVLVLANEVCLSDEQCAFIRDLVREGMALIATHQTSLFDLQTKKRKDFGLADVFGVSLQGVLPYKPGQRIVPEKGFVETLIPPDGLANHEEHLLVSANGAKIAARLTGLDAPEPGPPAVLLHEFGKGRVVYLPGRLESSFSLWGDLGFRDLIQSAVTWAARGQLPVKVACPDGPVGVTCFDQPGSRRRLLHLVSYLADWVKPYQQLPLLSKVQLSLRLPVQEKLASARAVLSGQNLAFSTRDGLAQLELPQLDEYEMIELKWQ